MCSSFHALREVEVVEVINESLGSVRQLDRIAFTFEFKVEGLKEENRLEELLLDRLDTNNL